MSSSPTSGRPGHQSGHQSGHPSGHQSGQALLALVEVMDRLRSPGGCPWDREQTHESLATYLLEETYETLEAIDSGDRDHLREELGDLLLQVVFHARIAGEHPADPWTIEEVAAGIRDKLVRRHPHVFGDATASTAAHVEARWEAMKSAEKGRTSALDGIPATLPALALATTTLSRAERAGVAARVGEAVEQPGDTDEVGDALLALVVRARAHGVDAEQALRRSVARYAERVRAIEAEGRAAPASAGSSSPEAASRRGRRR